MYSSFKILIILAVMAFALSGCGDLLGQKVVKKELDASQFQVECELDMDRFSKILEDNIGPEIRCLGENLNLFIRIVKSGKPGYLSRVQLEQYLSKHRPDVKPEVVKALKSVFDIGHLITGEDPDYISKDTVDKVINLALVFNEQAALHFGPIFENESPVKYTLHKIHRDHVSAATRSIIQVLRPIFNPNRNGEIHKLDMISLLESFTTDSNRDFIEKARKVLFVKKVLLGGESEILTHFEIEKLILNMDQLLLIALDIYRFEYILLDQESLLHMAKTDVTELYKIINFGSRESEVLFTINDLIEAAKLFIKPETLEIEKFRNLIIEAKKIAMKGNGSEVKGSELRTLFDHANSLLKTGTIFHRIYKKFESDLNNTRPVEETINFDEYRHTYPEHQAELEQFERIARKYRFMRGLEGPTAEEMKFTSSYYIRGFKRNANAMVEIALFEYLVRLVFSEYGSPSPNTDAVGGFSIDQKQMQKLMVKFEKELVALDLITPGKAISTSDNISLLGTLFQYQSDKNKVMDVNEATEFFVSLFSSLRISDKVYDYMIDQGCRTDRFDRIEPECFRKYYWQGLCSGYRTYFPLLFESLNTPKLCANFENTEYSSSFLDKAVSAARSCNAYTDGEKEEIPFAKGDFMTITVALMHAETTVLRWDVNNNNILDADEINRAYDIYGPALDGFLEDKNPIVKKFQKQIYQYMIKYEQVPDEKDFKSIWKFIKFLLSFDKRAPGNRKTIVSLLNVIGEQNAKVSTDPQFDCNLLRDPENIPEVDYAEIQMDKSPREMSRGEILSVLNPLSQFIDMAWNGDRASLREELLSFAEDTSQSGVMRVKDIRNKNMRRFFGKIAADKNLMTAISTAFPEGDEVQKITLSLTMILTNP